MLISADSCIANYGYGGGGGFSTTNYGAQGGADGGGFVGGSQQGSQDGNGKVLYTYQWYEFKLMQ